MNENVEEDFGIQESRSKSTSEILMTVHNHIIGFSIFFFIIGLLFYHTSTIKGNLKKIILFEPMFSILLSFGSLLGIHFYSNYFVIITIISATFMYIIFYFIVIILLYELLIKA